MTLSHLLPLAILLVPVATFIVALRIGRTDRSKIRSQAAKTRKKAPP